MLAAAPKTLTDKLQRVLNAAARVVSGTWKFDRGLLAVRHSELHWLDIPKRIIYKLGVMTWSLARLSGTLYRSSSEIRTLA